MRKENYGVPAALLNVMIYVCALYICVQSPSMLWVLIGLTVAVFVLGFGSTVKKTMVQANAIVLMFIAVNVLFAFIGYFFDFANTPDEFSGKSLDNTFNEFVRTVNIILNIAACVIFALLGIMALIKKDLFVGAVHMAVDGFIPRPVYQPQQPFNGQSQQPFNGQSQQPFNGQSQQPFNGQPQQFSGQPQQPFNGQPQQFNSQPQPFSGQPQHFNGQPQQPK